MTDKINQVMINKSDNKDDNLIHDNQYVFVRLPSNELKIIQLKKDSIISLGKMGSFLSQNIYNYPYGLSFEILDNNNVQKVKRIFDDLEINFLNDEENEKFKDCGFNIDDDENEMKKNVLNFSNDFFPSDRDESDNKTIYSKKKNLHKFQKKHLKRFTIDFLGTNQLLEFLINKDKTKVLNLSHENLGLILSLSNIVPGGNYLLIDETGGVILNSIFNKLCFKGSITFLHENEYPNIQYLKYLNCSEIEIKKIIKTINFLQFTESSDELIKENNDLYYQSKKYNSCEKLDSIKHLNEKINFVHEKQFDGLIIASTLDLVSVLKILLPRIKSSRSIVIYSEFKELLTETQQFLLTDKNILMPTIYETRIRKYQTFMNNFHPEMTSKSIGGYVLSAIKVQALKVN